MKHSWIAWGLAGLVPALAGTVANSTDPSSTGAPRTAGQEGAGGLTRVAPLAPDEEAREDEPSWAEAAPLDAIYWSAVLADSDLDAREDALEHLLQRAAEDPAAEAFLESVAGSEDDLLLAWTARLALRELACLETVPMQRRTPRFLRTPSVSFGDREVDELFDLERRFERLFGDRGPELDVFLHSPFGTRAPLGNVLRSHRGVEIQTGPEGVKIEVRAGGGDDESVKVYEAESLEAVLEQHPELRDELGLEVFANLGDPRRLRTFVLRPRGAAPAPRGRSVDRTDIFGVQVSALPAERATALGLVPGVGLHVDDVVPGSIARAVGLVVGDALLEISGVAMAVPDDVTAAMAGRGDGDTVRVRWIDGRGRVREKTWSPLERD